MKVLRKGDYIRHFQYGLGVVTGSNTEHTDIDFDVHGMKKFVTTIMTVEMAEGTPPTRRKTRRKKAAVVAFKPAVSS